MQPFAYEGINESTWMYVSTFLILSFFFKFNRVWSIRNLDLFLIIMLAPGLLLIQAGRLEHSQYLDKLDVQESELRTDPLEQSSQPIINQAGYRKANQTNRPADRSLDSDVVSEADAAKEYNAPGLSRQRFGYCWMFGIGGLIMLRMLLDPLLVRRPLLEPNLSVGGMVFMGVSLLVFVLANVAVYSPADEDIEGARNALKTLRLEASSEGEDAQLIQRGPGYRLLYVLPVLSTFENSAEIHEKEIDAAANKLRYVIAAKSVAITSQILIVLGLVLFSYYHFKNFHAGVGVATIYMLLPYTAIFTGNVLHTVPAALLIWALVCYRIPIASGIFIGLATGVSYYPLFLLALWISYYWDRGWRPFLVGFFISITICIIGLFFTSVDMNDFGRQLRAMFAFWFPQMDNLEGIWALGVSKNWRLPLLVGFVALTVSFAAWPSEKNLGTLVAYTAAVMAAVQFWHGFGGGLFVAWYLPLALLVIFRPNVAGRVATKEVFASRRAADSVA